MPNSPYEWNESIRQRNEYIEDRLKEGSPVIGLSCGEGVLLLCLRRSQRKIYEVYDKLIFSAIGNQADIEVIRTGAIDIAHREGFTRSPEDVSIQRIVGFAVSPSIKKVYGDPFAAPLVLRALFGELGKTAETDDYFVVGYDGEFSSSRSRAVIAGTAYAEERALEYLAGETKDGTPGLKDAIRIATRAWGIGRKHVEEEERNPDETLAGGEAPGDIDDFISDHLKDGWQIEAALLERDTHRESRYRLLIEAELGGAADQSMS